MWREVNRSAVFPKEWRTAAVCECNVLVLLRNDWIIQNESASSKGKYRRSVLDLRVAFNMEE